MQEPHEKGRANHLDPESCAGVGNRVGEALTGAHAGQPSSSEITSPGVPTLYGEREGHIRDSVICEPSWNTTESETLRMRGNSLHGNRETPKASTTPNARKTDGGAERPEKASWPHVGRVRFRGVGRLHSTEEAGEQSRHIGGGACGGKGADQGERPASWARTGHSAGYAWPRTTGRTSSGDAGQSLRSRHRG